MFEGQVVWITGASSGIGEAMAHQFLSDGAKLVLSARRETELERVKADLVQAGAVDANIMVLPLDVTDEAAMPSAVQAVLDHYGKIDVLYNNAGISQRSMFMDTEMVAYRKLFEVDVFGQIALTRQVAPVMVKQGSGHLMVTASVAGKVGVKERTGYCAAKHAMIGFFDALRTELAGDNIKVTVINPGFVRTAVAENAVTGDGGRFGKVDSDNAGGMDVVEFASKAFKGLLKGKPEILVAGREETLAAWLRRLYPRLLFSKLAKRSASKKA